MIRVACPCVAMLLTAVAGWAAPVVRSADVLVTFAAPASCTVEITFAVDAPLVEHRLDLRRGSRVVLLGVHGASAVGEPESVGHNRKLVLRPESARYGLRYTVEQPPDGADRCPLWIPTVPTEERGSAVRLTARIPSGATAVGTMPGFAWAGSEGTASIGHLPAFIRVPYALPGEPALWNIARIMDAVAVATLLAATVAWTRRRRG